MRVTESEKEVVAMKTGEDDDDEDHHPHSHPSLEGDRGQVDLGVPSKDITFEEPDQPVVEMNPSTRGPEVVRTSSATSTHNDMSLTRALVQYLLPMFLPAKLESLAALWNHPNVVKCGKHFLMTFSSTICAKRSVSLFLSDEVKKFNEVHLPAKECFTMNYVMNTSLTRSIAVRATYGQPLDVRRWVITPTFI
nr:unnamed protein product [Callosobruchus analis]